MATVRRGRILLEAQPLPRARLVPLASTVLEPGLRLQVVTATQDRTQLAVLKWHHVRPARPAVQGTLSDCLSAHLVYLVLPLKLEAVRAKLSSTNPSF